MGNGPRGLASDIAGGRSMRRIQYKPKEPEPPTWVEFTGRTGEWFGIWIVNVALTIATLGIFSAWAKVRRKKYFAQNTLIDGKRFDYHATGGQILLGRVIVIGAYLAINLILALNPFMGIFLLGLPFVMPWLTIRALKFNARQTSWANVRFDFQGRYGEALLLFTVAPIGMMLTLWLALPVVSIAIRKFTIGNHSLGRSRFNFEGAFGAFYAAFGLAALWLLIVAGGVAVFVIMPAFGFLLESALTEEFNPGAIGVIVMGLYIVLIVGLVPARIIYAAFLRNAVFAGISLDKHRFGSVISPPRYIWIAMSNAVAIALTLGLAVPWAQIRMARYLSYNTAVLPDGPIATFAGKVRAEGSAVGDAAMDLEGIDIGLPV